MNEVFPAHHWVGGAVEIITENLTPFHGPLVQFLSVYLLEVRWAGHFPKALMKTFLKTNPTAILHTKKPLNF